MVDYAEHVGGEVRHARRTADLALGPLRSPKLVEPPFVAVHVQAAVTHTIGGLRIDERARVLRDDATPIAGLYAAGADAGGVANGGYASGLAAALVFGRIAAETAAADAA
jgi:fumarate reductase flavoprotein subunit